MEIGSRTVLHALPLFPADPTTRIPAARTFWTAARSTLGSVQPSLDVQPQELLITAGARAGSGFSLFRSVGAMNH